MDTVLSSKETEISPSLLIGHNFRLPSVRYRSWSRDHALILCFKLPAKERIGCRHDNGCSLLWNHLIDLSQPKNTQLIHGRKKHFFFTKIILQSTLYINVTKSALFGSKSISLYIWNGTKWSFVTISRDLWDLCWLRRFPQRSNKVRNGRSWSNDTTASSACFLSKVFFMCSVFAQKASNASWHAGEGRVHQRSLNTDDIRYKLSAVRPHFHANFILSSTASSWSVFGLSYHCILSSLYFAVEETGLC